jgi:hypothetical protein
MVASRGLYACRSGRLGWIQGAVCAGLISVGCSASDHPAVFMIDTGGGGGDGVDPGNGDTGDTNDAGAPATTGNGSTGTTGVIGGTPGGVGVGTGTGTGTGISTAVDVVAPLASNATSYGVAPVAAPFQYQYGFAGLPQIALKGSQILYSTRDFGSPQLRIFVPDNAGTSAADTIANDIVVATPPCSDGPLDFLTGPDGRLIYQCEGGWYEAGKLIYSGGAPLNRLGYKNLALTFENMNAYVMNLTDGVLHEITGIDLYLTARASTSGFHFVSNGASYSLVAVDATGTGKTLGKFPAAAVQFPGHSSALAADDSLYELGVVGTTPTIMRFTLAGKSETVYSEKTPGDLDLKHGFLLTGP